MRPTVFIGSSTEGLPVAAAISMSLQDVAETTPWNEGVFRLGDVTIESLSSTAKNSDFAVLLFSPDDKITIREEEAVVARDNVLFELGMFMGVLGRERTFLVVADLPNLKLPNDLAGITFARYSVVEAKDDPARAVAKACVAIRAQILRLGQADHRRFDRLKTVTTQIDTLADKTTNLLRNFEAAQAKPKWFKDIVAAAPDIKHDFRYCHERGEPIRLQWLGMTMHNVWGTIPGLLQELAELQPTSVSVDVAMLSQAWLKKYRIKETWTDAQARNTEANIRVNFKGLLQFRNTKWSHRVRYYSHMPAIHGGLINDKFLYLGVSRWKDGEMSAGDRSYERFALFDSNHGDDKINMFKSWFDVCFAETPSQFLWASRPVRKR